MDSDDPIDIRGRVRAYGARQVQIARLAAPADWQGELREALASRRTARPLFARDGDFRLFVESFAVFFTAAMVFLF